MKLFLHPAQASEDSNWHIKLPIDNITAASLPMAELPYHFIQYVSKGATATCV